MRYKLSNKNEKEWNGKKFVEADLVDTNGEAFKVSAWAGEFDGVDEIETDLEKNDKGYWRMKKAHIQKPNFMKAKEASIEKAVERKEQGIARSQDNKDWSIKTSSTMNHAVDLAIAEYRDKTVLDGLDEAVLKWRRFLWNNWEVELKDTDPTTDKML